MGSTVLLFGLLVLRRFHIIHALRTLRIAQDSLRPRATDGRTHGLRPLFSKWLAAGSGTGAWASHNNNNSSNNNSNNDNSNNINNSNTSNSISNIHTYKQRSAPHMFRSGQPLRQHARHVGCAPSSANGWRGTRP